jgi:hypothetical protein
VGLHHGGTYPEVKVVAAVFEDGRTYRPDDLVHRIIVRHRLQSGYLQHAIELLQAGIKEGWDVDRLVSEGSRAREEKLHALEEGPDRSLGREFPLTVVVDNLMAMQKERPDTLTRAVNQLLEMELKKKELLDASLAAMGDPLATSTYGCE